MKILGKIFGRNKKKQEPQLTADELFAQRFTVKGGKFLYCTTEIEVQEAFRAIVNELGLYIKMSSNASPLIMNMFEEHTSLFGNPVEEANVYLSDCEYLIASEGGIMLSSNQMKHKPIEKMPETFIVFAKTSQIVQDISEGMRGLNKKYPMNQKPTGLYTLKNFTDDPEKNTVDTYGMKAKKTYLILLEDLPIAK